jgi:hypothetical protein
MKKIITIALASAIVLVSCKKDNSANYKVTYITSGTSVTQFKFTLGSMDNLAAVPFTGQRDTTIYVAGETVVKLESKASSNNLTGKILVNDQVVASGTDTDTDGDGKTQVKIDYSLPK